MSISQAEWERAIFRNRRIGTGLSKLWANLSGKAGIIPAIFNHLCKGMRGRISGSLTGFLAAIQAPAKAISEYPRYNYTFLVYMNSA